VRLKAAGHAIEVAVTEVVVGHAVEVEVRQRAQQVEGTRALYGDQPSGRRDVLDFTGVSDEGPEMLQVLRPRPRVDDHCEVVWSVAIDQRVVDDAAARVAEDVVPGLAHGEVGDPVGDHAFQRLHRAGPPEAELAHVRDIEEAHAFSNRDVLLPHRAVLQRHHPATELHHLPAQAHVVVVQRGPQRRPGRVVGQTPARFDSVIRTPLLAHSSGPWPGSCR